MVGNYIELSKVLYISPGFPANENDSTCIPALQDFFKELNRNGYGSDIVSLHYPLEAQYSWHGHQVNAFGWSNPSKLKKVRLLKKAINAITNDYRLKKVELIHSFWMTDASYIASKVAMNLKVPHVVTVMGQDVNKTVYSDQIVKGNLQLVTLSSFQQKLVKENLQPSQVIPWGIDKNDFKLKGEKLIDLITVGSLIDLKQAYQTIELVANLVELIPEIQAVIVGEGQNRNKLQDLISQKSLSKQVTLVGEKSRAETLALIAKSKILFHPSSYEGFGMTLIEGLAAGAFVVSYQTGATLDLDEVKSVRDFTEAETNIKQLLLGAETAEPTFPMLISDTVSQYLKLYQEVLI
jgi:glycosyltransferase involved in cell wall biosynthesis